MTDKNISDPLSASDIPRNPITPFRISLIVAICLAALALYIWSFIEVEFSFKSLIMNAPKMWKFLNGMFPLDWSDWKRVLYETMLTIQLALVGTTLSVIAAFPLSFLAAKNTAPRGIYEVVRFIFNAVRAVDTLVFALIFIAWVGLGPFPGMLALALHSLGMLGKLFSEAIESIDNKQVEALQSVGARRMEIIRWAVIPQVMTYFISYFLFRLEINIRAATVLGLVGAGGIGQYLNTKMNEHDFPKVSVIILTILILVMSIDALSNRIRRAIL